MDIGAFEAANTAARFEVFTSVPIVVTAGTPFNLLVEVVDVYGRRVTGYTGTVHFSGSDSNATLPADYTFTAADNGVLIFTGLVLHKKGNVTITVADALDSSIAGSLTEKVS